MTVLVGGVRFNTNHRLGKFAVDKNSKECDKKRDGEGVGHFSHLQSSLGETRQNDVGCKVKECTHLRSLHNQR